MEESKKSVESSSADDIERYLDEYRKTLSAVAGAVTKHPEMVSELRRVMNLSAGLFFSNRKEIVEQFQDTVKDMDAFLKKVEDGEVKAEDFITEESDRPKN